MSVRVEAGYLAGPWVGVAGPSVWLLADLDPADPAVASCFDLVHATADAPLHLMADARLRSAPNVAVLRLDGSGAEIAVRGEAVAEISTMDGESSQVRAVPGAWESRTIAGFAVVRLHASGVGLKGDAPLPIGADMVRASGIVVRVVSEPSTVEEAEPGLQSAWVLGLTVPPDPEPQQMASMPPHWLPSPTGPAGAPPGPAVPAGPAVPMPSPPPPPTIPAPPPPSTMPAPPPPPAPGPAPRGAGFIDAVPWASVPDDPEPEPYPAPPPYPPPAWAQPAPPTYPAPQYAAPPPPPQQQYPAPPYPGQYAPPPQQYAPPPYGVPQPYPAAPPPYAPPPYAAPSQQYAGPAQHSPAPLHHAAPGHPTPGGIDPELLKTTKRHSGPRATGPVVTAVLCTAGHANRPEAQTCRSCRGSVPPQTPQSMPRPVLGVLRLSTGDSVPLDKGVILGRATGQPDGFGRDEPHRINLVSPDGTISRRHVEVVLDGWDVIVVDLDSTNGTMVTPAGEVSRMLRNERLAIEPGCVVSLDDTTWFRYEVAE